MRGLLLMITCLVCSSTLFAQNLTGKWVGYFTPNAELNGRVYTYEIHIQENRNHELNAFTITQFSNHAIAKASANILFSTHSQLVSIKENKFDQLQIDPNMQACLMNNFLTYQNIRGHEMLQGNYMSTNIATGKDCGGGTVFLEKVESTVQTIKPNLKISNNTNNKIATTTSTISSNTNASKLNITNTASKNKVQNIPIVNTSTNIDNTKPKTIVVPKQNIATNTINTASQPIAINKGTQDNKTTEIILPEDAATENKDEESIKKQNDFQVIPWVLVGRENKLVKKIITHNKTISIDMYDNGTIDNDTIIVYDNKQLIVNKKRLSYKAIHFDVNFSNNNNEHEIIIVAHNMGTVPPNTALLVYKDADIRQELFITSTNKMNAKLIIEYVPPAKLE